MPSGSRDCTFKHDVTLPLVSGKNCNTQWRGQNQEKKNASGSNESWTCTGAYVRKLFRFPNTEAGHLVLQVIRSFKLKANLTLTCRCTNMVITFFACSNGDSSPGKELFMVKPTSIHSTTAAWKQSPKEYFKIINNSHKKERKEMCPVFISSRKPVLIFRG